MAMFGNQKIAKNRHSFYCEFCDYNTVNYYDYKKHIKTIKHKNAILAMNIAESSINLSQKSPLDFKCQNCTKIYKDNSGLWRHKKTCKMPETKDMGSYELVSYLLKENSEFKQMIMEMSKNSGNNNNNTTNNNQSFNINVYLNETCKNAMNITEFVDQLKIDNNDLEETGRLGYAEGISRIIINGLNNLNVSDRPIHCSDGKRETIYIKDNNVWNKETTDKNILTNAVKCINKKNIKQIFEWTKCNPEYKNSSSKVNDRYLKIVSESMSGSTSEETNKNYEKIIRNVANATLINKV
jgi:hypothetical protein